MPDLNELLRWSIAHSAPRDGGVDTPQPQSQSQSDLALRFNPTTNPSAGSSALHPSDPLYRASQTDDASPASTSGPRTPQGGATPLPGVAKRQDLTTEMLDLIMGKSDSMIMKEKMEMAMDESKSVDQRVGALDDFEMLIELIDNANNMAVLKLWDPLVTLLSSPHQPIVAHACWVIGTAVQNNLKAQAALYIFNVLPSILSIIFPTSSAPPPATTRAKANYAFSSAVKHWPLVTSALSSNSSQGYNTLLEGVADSEPVIRRKMAFLVGTLTMQSGEKYEGEIPNEVRNLIEERIKETAGQPSETLVDGLKHSGVYSALIKALASGSGDVEFEGNALNALARAAEKGGLSGSEKAQVKTFWESWTENDREERSLGGEDGKEISAALA